MNRIDKYRANSERFSSILTYINPSQSKIQWNFFLLHQEKSYDPISNKTFTIELN